MVKMKDYSKEFAVYLTETKKLSKNSYDSYIRDFTQYCNFAYSKNVEDIRNADNAFIKSYFKYLKRSGKSAASASRALATLKCYYSFLISIDVINETPVFGVDIAKAEKTFPETLTNKEVKLLLNQPDVTTQKGIRDKAMLEVLYATGMRVSELIGLKINNVNIQLGILHIINEKGERVIPMYPEALACLAEYINNVRKLLIYDRGVDELFVNASGRPMTRQGFWKIIKFYASKAKINKEITPHTLRHSFAEHLLENGAPLSDIKDILGHSDISSTQLYAQMLKSKYAQSYKKYHPMANK